MNDYTPLKRTVLLVALAFSGAVVAFATVTPSPQAEATLLQRSVVEPLALDAAEAILPAPTLYMAEERFQRGDTLQGLLARLGVADDDARQIARTPSSISRSGASPAWWVTASRTSSVPGSTSITGGWAASR